jgi:hypothetical protein
LRRPEVPGLWSSNGLVATVRIIGVLPIGGWNLRAAKAL